MLVSVVMVAVDLLVMVVLIVELGSFVRETDRDLVAGVVDEVSVGFVLEESVSVLPWEVVVAVEVSSSVGVEEGVLLLDDESVVELCVLVGDVAVFSVVVGVVSVSEVVFVAFVEVDFSVSVSELDLLDVFVAFSVVVSVVKLFMVVFVEGSSVFVPVVNLSVVVFVDFVEMVLVLVKLSVVVVDILLPVEGDCVEEESVSVVEDGEVLDLVVLVTVLTTVFVVVFVGMVMVGRMSVIPIVDFVLWVVEEDD